MENGAGRGAERKSGWSEIRNNKGGEPTRSNISRRERDSPFRASPLLRSPAAETIGLSAEKSRRGRRRSDGKRRARRRREETGRRKEGAGGGRGTEEERRSKEVNCPEIFNPVERPRDPLLARRVSNGQDKFPIGSMANRVKRFSRLVILCFHPVDGRRRRRPTSTLPRPSDVQTDLISRPVLTEDQRVRAPPSRSELSGDEILLEFMIFPGKICLDAEPWKFRSFLWSKRVNETRSSDGQTRHKRRFIAVSLGSLDIPWWNNRYN